MNLFISVTMVLTLLSTFSSSSSPEEGDESESKKQIKTQTQLFYNFPKEVAVTSFPGGLTLEVVKSSGITNKEVKSIFDSLKSMLVAADLWNDDDRQILAAAFADAAKTAVQKNIQWNIIICRTLSCYWIIPQCSGQKHVQFKFDGFYILLHACFNNESDS